MKYKGSCHCGNVQYEVEANFDKAISCNCSICQRKGTILIFVPDDQFKLIQGQNSLTDYQFGKKVIHHYFCSTCGITSFAAAQMPDGKKMRAINIRCLENLDLTKIKIDPINGRDF